MDLMNADKLKNNQMPTCPNCNKILDGFSSPHSSCEPKNGDVTICIYCNTINQFVIKGATITLTEADADVIVQLDFIELQRANEFVELANGFNKIFNNAK